MEDGKYRPRRQGDLGEAAAIEWLTSRGAVVWVALTTARDADLIAEWPDRLDRVQVKTCIRRTGQRYHVQLATRGGNQSWSGVSKLLDPGRCDALYVHVGDGRRWYIPTRELGGYAAILVGGPRYAAWEIEPGRPLPARPAAAVASPLDSPAPWRDSEAVKRTGL